MTKKLKKVAGQVDPKLAVGQTLINLEGGGAVSNSIFSKITTFIHDHISALNNSKFFAGCIMILLNVGSKFISIQFSKSTEEYLKMSVSKQILVFAMAWMGTRDIYAALALTAVFVVLSDHIFNEESHLCMVPHHYRVLNKIELGPDGITEDEINTAIAVLDKAKKEKQKHKQKELYANNFKDVSNN